MSRQQLSVHIGLLTGHLSLNGHFYKIGKDINPLYRRCLSGNESVEHLLYECASLTMSRGRIFGQSFGELQQLSHVRVDLFWWFATETGLAGKYNRSLKVAVHWAAMTNPLKPITYRLWRIKGNAKCSGILWPTTCIW